MHNTPKSIRRVVEFRLLLPTACVAKHARQPRREAASAARPATRHHLFHHAHDRVVLAGSVGALRQLGARLPGAVVLGAHEHLAEHLARILRGAAVRLAGEDFADVDLFRVIGVRGRGSVGGGGGLRGLW